MIEPTDEMREAFERAFADAVEDDGMHFKEDREIRLDAGLAAVLAIVERGYAPRRCPLDGSTTCFSRQDGDDGADLADDDCLRLEPGAECPAEGSPRCRSCVWRPAGDVS